MDDVSAVCGSKMVPFKKREKQTFLQATPRGAQAQRDRRASLKYVNSSWPVRARVCWFN